MLMGARKKCDITNSNEFTTNDSENANFQINTLSSNPTTRSNTLKQFVRKSRRVA